MADLLLRHFQLTVVTFGWLRQFAFWLVVFCRALFFLLQGEANRF